MLLTAEEIQAAENCMSGAEWEGFCDAVKAARDGDYPEDWWPEMKLSGRMDRIMSRWGESSALKLHVVNPDGSERRIV